MPLGNATTTAAAPTMDHTPSSSLDFGYVLLPLLLLEISLSSFSNMVLLALICRSRRSMTVLNVFLLSLAGLNLMLTANQVILVALISTAATATGGMGEGRGHNVPPFLCHFTFGVQCLGTNGIALFQVVISYNRFRTSKNPIQWESNLKRAWITGALVWVFVVLAATLESILHIGGIGGEEAAVSCFWPRLDQHLPFKLSLQLSIFLLFVVGMAFSAYYHVKTIGLLRANHASLVQEMEMTSAIRYYQSGPTTPEKTAKALVVVFLVHMLSLFVPKLYETIRALVITSRWDHTGDTRDPSPDILLLVLTSMGLFTTTAPSFLLLVSKRFKRNVVSIFKCRWCRLNRDVYLQNTNAMPRTCRQQQQQQRGGGGGGRGGAGEEGGQPERCHCLQRNTSIEAVNLSIFLGVEAYNVIRYKPRHQHSKLELISLESLSEDEEVKSSPDTRCHSGVSDSTQAIAESGLVVGATSQSDRIKDFFRGAAGGARAGAGGGREVGSVEEPGEQGIGAGVGIDF